MARGGGVVARCGECADDHTSIVSLEADPASWVVAAIKSSFNNATTPDPNPPLVWPPTAGSRWSSSGARITTTTDGPK